MERGQKGKEQQKLVKELGVLETEILITEIRAVNRELWAEKVER